MNDEEKHEHLLAAKAAGYKVKQIYPGTISRFYNNTGDTVLWKPKTINADAFRLMCRIKLGLDFLKYNEQVISTQPRISVVEVPFSGEDIESVARLAIFRAAVEIGRAMS